MWCDVARDKRAMSAAMMNHSRRQIFPSNKRKERDEGFNVLKKPSTTVTTKTLARPSLHRPAPPKPPDQPRSNNHLLAGYLAHEFLTKGTLFGEPYDPARAEAVPLSARTKPSSTSSQKPKAEKQPQEQLAENHQRYMEVSHLLKTDGAHFPGVVNPTQLDRCLQLG